MILRVRRAGGAVWTTVGPVEVEGDERPIEAAFRLHGEALNDHPLRGADRGRADDVDLEVEVDGWTGTLEPGDYVDEGGQLRHGAPSVDLFTAAAAAMGAHVDAQIMRSLGASAAEALNRAYEGGVATPVARGDMLTPGALADAQPVDTGRAREKWVATGTPWDPASAGISQADIDRAWRALYDARTYDVYRHFQARKHVGIIDPGSAVD